MSSQENRLQVFANMDASWTLCGRLTLTEDGPDILASSFRYYYAYLQRGGLVEIDPVSLRLVNRIKDAGKELRPVNELSLFGSLRDAAPESWGRRVIESKLGAPASGLPESTYLLHAGSERVGALDVRSRGTDPPTIGAADWHSLTTLAAASELIERGQPVPTHLENIYTCGAALGGARPKASVRASDGVLWLAKFNCIGDHFDVPIIEHGTLRLASQAGLHVPPVWTELVNGRTVMLIRRFDRVWKRPSEPKAHSDEIFAGAGDGRAEHHLPFVSSLTLLGCHESESRHRSYGDIATAMRKYCCEKAVDEDVLELFKRMVFNIFVSNDDDHLKNVGFLWDVGLRSWRLSPLYDVLPRPSVATERCLHLGIGQNGRLATLDNAFSARGIFKLTDEEALESIAQIWNTVREWRSLLQSFGVHPCEINKVETAFRDIDEIASPELRRRLP
jgi:serine/threonine-protein kinase HipA